MDGRGRRYFPPWPLAPGGVVFSPPGLEADPRRAYSGVMIPIARGLFLDERDIEERFIRASGPGGQNVNKVATAVQLRFRVCGVSALPEAVRDRLRQLAGRRVSTDGMLVIEAQRFRTQERNRRDARERLIHWLQRAAERPAPRLSTRPSAAAKRRRRDDKRRRGAAKQLRRVVSHQD